MAHATPSEADVVNTLSKLELSPKTSQSKAKPKSAPVADSWDDDVSTGSDTETEGTDPSRKQAATSIKDSLSAINTTSSYDAPNPPPPTPASPTPFEFPDNAPFGSARAWDDRRGSNGANAPAKRPDKTTAVAGRLIAAGLGVRAPKRTDEEREYDKAMREKAKKQRDEERNRERMEREQAEARRKAVWED